MYALDGGIAEGYISTDESVEEAWIPVRSDFETGISGDGVTQEGCLLDVCFKQHNVAILFLWSAMDNDIKKSRR